jgi:hypothetical protein
LTFPLLVGCAVDGLRGCAGPARPRLPLHSLLALDTFLLFAAFAPPPEALERFRLRLSLRPGCPLLPALVDRWQPGWALRLRCRLPLRRWDAAPNGSSSSSEALLAAADCSCVQHKSWNMPKRP